MLRPSNNYRSLQPIGTRSSFNRRSPTTLSETIELMGRYRFFRVSSGLRLLRHYSFSCKINVMNSSPEAIAKLCVNTVLIALVAISAVRGWRRGLAAVIFSCFRWIICIGGASFAAFPIKNYLIERTTIDEEIMAHVKSTMTSSITGSSFFMAMPEQLRGVFATYQQNASIKIATTTSETLLKVISFLFAFLVLIIVTKLFALGIKALSKKKKGPVGLFNAFLGGCFGLLRGVFIVSLAMLALFPLLSFADPRAVSPIVNGIRESEIAGLLYDNNPILMLFQMF